MSIFVDRQNVFDSFNLFIQRNSPHWLLLLDGVDGIGKTAVLNQLRTKQSSANRLIQIDFTSPVLNSDPLALLNRLASELPTNPFQQFTADLLKAYEGLESAHIKTENKIVVNRGSIFTGEIVQTASGPFEVQDSESDTTLKRLFVECNISLEVEGVVSNNQILQIASVNLGQALRDLKRHIRDELTTRFVTIIDDYLQSRTNEQIILFIDNLDQVQKKPTGAEYLAWFLESLLATIHRRISTRLRVVLTNTSAANWPESSLPQASQITLESLVEIDVQDYLHQRNVHKSKIIKGIFKLTDGHPLCLVLATDLFGLAPDMGVRDLQRYATQPFDSRLLAHKLFLAIVDHMPDEAMKKLLRYGPILRVLDDEAIENILAVELGLAKDQIKEMLEKLRDYAIFEDTEEFIFRPVIHEQVLADFRQNAANDPLYRRLNRRAYEWYGQQWSLANGRQRSLMRYQMIFHEVNLVPQKAEQVIKQQIDESFREDDPDLAYEFIEWAQADETISVSSEEKAAWEKKAPDEIHLQSREPQIIDPPNDDEAIDWIRDLFSSGGRLIWRFMKRSYGGVKNYITSPLRKLESHLRRSKKLMRLQQKISNNLTRRQIPKMQSVQQQANDLQQRILFQEIPNAEDCQATNSQLASQIQQASMQQQKDGLISSTLFDSISQQTSKQNKVIGKYNRQVQDFNRKHNRLSSDIQKVQKIIADSDVKLAAMYQENESLYQESQALFESGRVMVFHSDQEQERANRLIDEIQRNYETIKSNADQVQEALDEFWRIQPHAVQAINDFQSAIEHMNSVIAAANSMLESVAGTQLLSDDNRTLKISVRYE